MRIIALIDDSGVIERVLRHLSAWNLQPESRDVSGEARQKVEEQLNQLKELAEPAREKMQELMQSGEERWQSLSAEADKTYKALVHSYNYFKSKLR